MNIDASPCTLPDSARDSSWVFQMPWMTGLHVACSVRAAGLKVPVIVMTALPISAATVDVLGPETVLLRKPFRLEQLVGAATRLLYGN